MAGRQVMMTASDRRGGGLTDLLERGHRNLSRCSLASGTAWPPHLESQWVGVRMLASAQTQCWPPH